MMNFQDWISIVLKLKWKIQATHKAKFLLNKWSRIKKQNENLQKKKKKESYQTLFVCVCVYEEATSKKMSEK